MKTNLCRQFAQLKNTITILFVCIVIVFMITYGLSRLFRSPMGFFTTDAATYYGFNQFTGFTTVIGVFFLIASIGSVIFSWSLLNERPTSQDRRSWIFIGIFALITLYLALDDMFLFHEWVLSGLFKVGERSIFAAYLSLFGVFVFFFRKELRQGPRLMFLIAVGFLAISLATDVISDKLALATGTEDFVDLIEEISKLAGFIFWSAYLGLRARGLLRSTDIGNESGQT